MPWQTTLKFFFVVYGAPKGKQRPRKGGNFYTPASTRRYEAAVKRAFEASNIDKEPPINGHVGIVIDAYYPIPITYKDPNTGRRKKVPAKMAEDMVYNKIRPCTTPDWDNIGKIICDGLNGLAYEDDKQIVDPVGPRKWYSTSPRVEVRIYELSYVARKETP